LKPINTIWISTAARTGSMWFFNVTREIFRIVGRQVEPEVIPHRDEEMIQQATQFAFPSQDPSKVWVLKIHTILKPDIHRSKIITTHRDLRDVVVSFKEFMGVSFEDSFGCARVLVNFTKTYEEYDPGYLMLVAYNDIETRPVDLILEIAEFVDVQISEINAREIVLKYSRNNVKSIIEKSNKSLAKNIVEKNPIDPRDMVYFSDSNYRAFDRKTGFQTGHISQRKTGDWKHVLSSTQQQQFHAEFGSWLKKYGYQE